ncbi:putative mitochondrial protein [Tanacetum coccineum]
MAWNVYEEAILKRFGSVNEDPMAELKNLDMFIAALPASIELNVGMFRPKSLADAFSLANLQEATLVYVPGHKCEGHVFTLEIRGGGIEECLEEEEDESDMIAYELSEQTPQSLPHISLNVFSGVPTQNTMRLKGHVLKQILHILIDSGVYGWGYTNDHSNLMNAYFNQLLEEYANVFEVPKELHPQRRFDYKIHLKEENVAINISPYRYPPNQKDTIKAMVKELLDSGVIRPSNSPFLSHIVMVKKKDGSWRMCIEYRSGYHQIRMCEKDVYKTAFKTHEGHYEFVVIPFGLTNAPSTFQALMNSVFKPFLRKFTLVFFDDILVYSPSTADHITHLRMVLQAMRENTLFTKQSKSMQEWPIPITLKQLRGFLGLTGYYRRFIKGYATIGQPLTMLLKKNAFQWNLQAQEAFKKLQQDMIQSLVLALPNFDEEFVIKTDASGFGLGAVLQQNKHPIAYLSKTLALKHQSLSTYEKELLAMLPKLLGFDYDTEYNKGAAMQQLMLCQELRGKVFFSLLARTSNELMDDMVATWSSDLWLQATIKGLQNNTLTNSNFAVGKGTSGAIAQFNLKKAQDRMKSRADKNRSDRSFEINDWVYLKLQPYRQLILPDYAKVHPVFHVSQLQPCYTESATMGSFPLCDDEGLLAATPLMLLERKMVKQNNRMVVFGLIQWSNGSEEDATWEKLEDILARFPEFTLDL